MMHGASALRDEMLLLPRVSPSRVPIEDTSLGEDLAELGLPSSSSIAFARCSITAWSAVLAAVSDRWTGRF